MLRRDCDDNRLATARKEIRRVLVNRARNRSVVAYSEVVRSIKAVSFAPDDPAFHRLLDEVSEAEDRQGRGLLTVVVVHKDGDMRPGPGFFELAKRRGRNVSNVDAAWLAELDKVWGYWKAP